MIVDNFMFNDDAQLLELRYYMLKDVVDYFVVSEANHTFSGQSKPFYGRKIVEELKLDINKFIFLETDVSKDKLSIQPLDKKDAGDVDNLDKVDVYARLRTQKDAIQSIIDRFPEDAVIMHGDVDEIPDPKAVKYIASVCRKYPENIIKIPLVLLESSADKRVYNELNEQVKWNRAFMFCTKKAIKDVGPAALRSEFENTYKPILITENGKEVEDLGWHFTWMGSSERKIQKAKITAHSTAIHLIDNVTEETKDLLKKEIGDDFGKVVKYHHRPYPHSKLPKQIFELERVKNFLLPHLKEPKIVDYSMYFNEKELLELRYHMLKDVVDLFIISESNVTFSGNNKEFSLENVIKELDFDVNKIRIIKKDLKNIDVKSVNHLDQIGSIVAKDTDNILSWTRERLQRDALLDIVDEYDDDCVFICSDIDEIIMPTAISYLTDVCRANQHVIIKVPLVFLESRADKRITDKNGAYMAWDKSMFLATKKQLKVHPPNTIRAGMQRSFTITYITQNNARVEDLGWHFTWMGNTERKKVKAINYGHAGNLDVVNTLSEDTRKILSNVLNKPINITTEYNLVDYDISLLPKEVFTLKKVKDFLLPNEEVITEKPATNNLLLNFVNDPLNFAHNFNLGYSFEKLGQTAAAVSFYLRTAEKTVDSLIQYESLLRIANCFKLQRNRHHTVVGLYNRAITVNPLRIEAYYLMAKTQYDNKDYQAAYLYAVLGLSLTQQSIEFIKPLATDVNYPGKFALEYIKAISSWYVGFYTDSKQRLIELLNRQDVDQTHKDLIKVDLESVIKI